MGIRTASAIETSIAESVECCSRVIAALAATLSLRVSLSHGSGTLTGDRLGHRAIVFAAPAISA
jgi:hypothetical protein